jgi:hypothetical protein
MAGPTACPARLRLTRGNHRSAPSKRVCSCPRLSAIIMSSRGSVPCCGFGHRSATSPYLTLARRSPAPATALDPATAAAAAGSASRARVTKEVNAAASGIRQVAGFLALGHDPHPTISGAHDRILRMPAPYLPLATETSSAPAPSSPRSGSREPIHRVENTGSCG